MTILEVSQVIRSVVARRNRCDDPIRRELQQLMTSVVDIRDKLLHAFDDDAHRTLSRLLTRCDVNVMLVHQLVDRVAVDVDLRIIKYQGDWKVSLKILERRMSVKCNGLICLCLFNCSRF